MNFSQKLGLFILIAISAAYVYFSFFSKEGIHIPTLPSFNHEDENNSELPPAILDEITTTTPNEVPTETPQKHTVKTVKIFVTDSNGKIRSLNRKCDTAQEKSCFAFAIKELVSAPSNWEKSKGFTSEIPSNTKILSIREGEGSVMIDLSSAFESGGGAESTYTRVMQVIKTAKANTNLPVYLYINGKQADVIGGEGIMIKQPLSERSLDD